jgi:ribonuclease HII
MTIARSYTWRNVKKEVADEIRLLLLKGGWKEDGIKNYTELWRIKREGINIVFYKNGTFFINYSERAFLESVYVWRFISKKLGSRYTLPDRDILIGLDETGKGEVIGSIMLVGVMFPREIFTELDLTIDNADTKYSHRFEYWDRIAKGIMNLQSQGFSFVLEKILPSDIDNKNMNKVMDERYKKILLELTEDILVDKCRIVIDNYGVGGNFSSFIDSLKERGASIAVKTKSEDSFLETKVASIIAKWERMKELKDIGISFLTGNLGDKNTIKWLEDWYKKYKYWPWFVKRSFQMVKDIEKSFIWR